MDEAIVQYLKRQYSLLVGERTAERSRIEGDRAQQLQKVLTMDVKGRDRMGGLPKTVTVTGHS